MNLAEDIKKYRDTLVRGGCSNLCDDPAMEREHWIKHLGRIRKLILEREISKEVTLILHPHAITPDQLADILRPHYEGINFISLSDRLVLSWTHLP